MTVSLGPDTAVLKGHDITLTPSVTGGIPPFKYFWSTFDTTSSLTLTIDSGMIVGVAIMDAANNAGFATVNISVRYPPGIEEVSGGSLQIMPNPARGTFRVLLPAGMTSGRITISGMSGRELYSEHFTAAKGEISVQAANLAAGAFIVKVDDGKKYFTGKLIIQ
jgi:hypothetical protein